MATGALINRLPSSAPQMGYPTLQSVPRPAFYDSLPGSGAEARSRAAASDGYGATGKSMPYVSVGITMVKFMGEYAYVRDATDGQLVFYNNQDNLTGDEAAVITVDALNDVLKKGWAKGVKALASAVTTRLFSDLELATLLTTPTADWHTLGFLQEKIRLAKTDEEIGVTFLCPEIFAASYRFFGWIRGMGPEISFTPQKTVRVSGSLESVENIWGNKILTGDRLFLILKRVYDEQKRQWGHFAYVPWAGRQCDPPLSATSYIDATGYERTGRVFYVGTVETWMDHVEISDSLLPGYLHLEPSVLSGPQERQPSCLRITYGGRPRTKLPFLIY